MDLILQFFLFIDSVSFVNSSSESINSTHAVLFSFSNSYLSQIIVISSSRLVPTMAAYCVQQIHTSMLPFLRKKPGQSGGPTSVSFRTGFPFATPLSTFLKPKRNVDNKGFAAGHVMVVSATGIGIDLGTTNSVVAATRPGQSVPVIIPSSKYRRSSELSTPSVVGYTDDGDCIVGEMAKQQAAINPENTFSSVKNFIGKKRCEIDKELENKVSYGIVAGVDNNNVRLKCPAVGKHFAVEEISAQVLRKLVNDASRFLKDEVTKAVITVPARFNDSQIKATWDAGRIAGLDNALIMLEPMAASLAYAYKGTKPQILLVFDLGGATLEVTVLKVSYKESELLSTSWDVHLGGQDFDKRIVDWLASSFKSEEGIELLEDKHARQHLTEVAENVKLELSSVTEANISLPSITSNASGPKHINTTLTRAKFEELCADLLDRLTIPVEKCIRDAKLSMRDLDEVILVGGSTHIPAVQEHVKKLTGIEPKQTIDPSKVIALGAAIMADDSFGGLTIGKPLLKTPLSVGLETLGGVMKKVIPWDTRIPTSRSQVFSTATDGQTSVKINVLQGEGDFTRNTRSVGCFRLDGIPPAPRGVPQINVTFDIDAKGLVTVTAVDMGTGKMQHLISVDATKASWLSVDEATRIMVEKQAYRKKLRANEGKEEQVDSVAPTRGLLVA